MYQCGYKPWEIQSMVWMVFDTKTTLIKWLEKKTIWAVEVVALRRCDRKCKTLSTLFTSDPRVPPKLATTVPVFGPYLYNEWTGMLDFCRDRSYNMCRSVVKIWERSELKFLTFIPFRAAPHFRTDSCLISGRYKLSNMDIDKICPSFGCKWIFMY